MGIFDKLKSLTNSDSADKQNDSEKKSRSKEINEKMSSAMSSFRQKLHSSKIKEEPAPSSDPLGIEKFIDGAMDKTTSSIDSFGDTLVEKTEQYSDIDNLKEMAKNSDNKYVASSATFMEGVSNGDSMEDSYNAAKEVYQERSGNGGAGHEDKPKDNKKTYKNLAKGAMFVGSFLYSQKYEGADSGSALMHAFNKTKEVDDYFEGRESKKPSNDANNNQQNSASEIKSIAHYQYICPKNNRGHNINVPDIDVPTVHSNGCPERSEAIQAIMQATGVNQSMANAIWNGGSNLHWKKVSYTYVNHGKLGGTVKC